MNIKFVLSIILVTVLTLGLKFKFNGGCQGSFEGREKRPENMANYITTSPEGIAVSEYFEEIKGGETTARVIVNSAASYFRDQSSGQGNFQSQAENLVRSVFSSLNAYKEKLQSLNSKSEPEASKNFLQSLIYYLYLNRSFTSAFISQDSDNLIIVRKEANTNIVFRKTSIVSNKFVFLPVHEENAFQRNDNAENDYIKNSFYSTIKIKEGDIVLVSSVKQLNFILLRDLTFLINLTAGLAINSDLTPALLDEGFDEAAGLLVCGAREPELEKTVQIHNLIEEKGSKKEQIKYTIPPTSKIPTFLLNKLRLQQQQEENPKSTVNNIEKSELKFTKICSRFKSRKETKHENIKEPSATYPSDFSNSTEDFSFYDIKQEIVKTNWIHSLIEECPINMKKSFYLDPEDTLTEHKPKEVANEEMDESIVISHPFKNIAAQTLQNSNQENQKFNIKASLEKMKEFFSEILNENLVEKPIEKKFTSSDYSLSEADKTKIQDIFSFTNEQLDYFIQKTDPKYFAMKILSVLTKLLKLRMESENDKSPNYQPIEKPIIPGMISLVTGFVVNSNFEIPSVVFNGVSTADQLNKKCKQLLEINDKVFLEMIREAYKKSSKQETSNFII
jgi:hypothetical protein